MKTTPKNPAAVAMGKMKSDAKTAAARENGKKGGRPKKAKPSHEFSLTHKFNGRKNGIFTLRDGTGQIMVVANGTISILRAMKKHGLSIPEIMEGPKCWDTEWTATW